VHEIATRLDVSPVTTKVWRRAGSLKAYRYNDKGQCLFEGFLFWATPGATK
jgi:predicted site-specific integrase-resolvase